MQVLIENFSSMNKLFFLKSLDIELSLAYSYLSLVNSIYLILLQKLSANTNISKRRFRKLLAKALTNKKIKSVLTNRAWRAHFINLFHTCMHSFSCNYCTIMHLLISF